MLSSRSDHRPGITHCAPYGRDVTPSNELVQGDRLRDYTVTEVGILTPSQNLPLRGKLTMSNDMEPVDPIRGRRGVILWSGLSVGHEGRFVKEMEAQILRTGMVAATLRANMHRHDDIDTWDLTGFRLTNAIQDVVATIDFLKARNIHHITAVCSSFSAQAALLAVAHGGAAIDKLVCRAGVTNCLMHLLPRELLATLDQIPEQFPFQYPLSGGFVTVDAGFAKDLQAWNTKLEDLYPKIAIPMTFVHGSHDEHIPYNVTMERVALLNQDLVAKVEIGGADHNFSNEELSSQHYQILLGSTLLVY